MAQRKKRVRQHIMEERSFQIVRDALPAEWVVRVYRPDYGIDLSVELFEFADRAGSVAEALGETIFVQMKSTDVVRCGELRVHARSNVEKAPLQEDTEFVTIETARLRVDTSELLTVQAMGAAVPVILFLVELSTHRIYFVCLNDLIEKVILPRDPDYSATETTTIHIPFRNCITAGRSRSVMPLGLYAKRPKLYAAFQKFGYQAHELEFALPDTETLASEPLSREDARHLVEMVRHFLSIDLRYDFWTKIPEWRPIGWAFEELSGLDRFLETDGVLCDEGAMCGYLMNAPGDRRAEWYLRQHDMGGLQAEFCVHLHMLWSRLVNLSRMYEEVVREWFLPTYLSNQLSPDPREA
jgi:hypothetical protein